MKVIEPSKPYDEVADIEENLKEEAEALQSENQYDSGLVISVHIKPRQYSGVKTADANPILEELTGYVNYIQGDVVHLGLSGDRDGELLDFGVEYSLKELKKQIPDVRQGMMLKCTVKREAGQKNSLHFKPFTPQPLSLEERQAIQEKYDEIFKDVEFEGASVNEKKTKLLTIHVIGAGIGESIILELPNGQWGVVDCYASKISDETTNQTLNFLKRRKVETLAFLCLTHPHQDHFRGITHLLNRYKGKLERFWIFPARPGKVAAHLEVIAKESQNQEIR
jgi:hypothetical protein